SYGIRTIATPGWTDADAALAAMIRDATVSPMDRSTGGAPATRELSITVGIGLVRVTVSATRLPAGTADALAVSVGTAVPVGADPRPRTLAGATFAAVYGHDAAPRLAGAIPGRAVRWPDDEPRWLLFGQEEGAYGRTGFVHTAVLDFLRQAVALGHARVHLPLVAGGGGRLSPHDALACELHAIGRFAAEATRRLEVEVHLPPGPPPTRLLLADLADGRIAPAPILFRGRDNTVRLTVIYPTRAQDLVALPVSIAADATAGALLEALVDPAEPRWLIRFHDGEHRQPWDPTGRLDALHVTDGCVVTLDR
ncbi:MAG: hypothetical protein ABMB14_00375, partial [Myxococcota bacterium]